MLNTIVYTIIFQLVFIINIEAKVQPEIWNVPMDNKYFVGREKELYYLYNKFNKQDIILILGPGGIGKTQLAKKYAHYYSANYDIVWWFSSSENIIDQFIRLAQELSMLKPGTIDPSQLSTSGIISYVKNTLRTIPKKWLLIFDNIDNVNNIKEYIPETHKAEYKNVIITSRNLNEEFDKIKLNIFSEKEAQNYINLIVPQIDEVATNKLIKLLDCYPLALSQALAYIKTNNIKINQYISMYNEDRNSVEAKEKYLLDQIYGIFDLDSQILNNTIGMNLNNITNKSKEATYLLKIMSIIGTKDIPEYLLKDIMQSLLGKINIDPIFEKTILILKQSSLIEEYSDKEQKYYFIHDFIKSFIMGNYEIDKKVYLSVINSLNNRLNKPWGEMVAEINSNTALLNIAYKYINDLYNLNIRNEQLYKLMIALLEHNNLLYHFNSNYILYQEFAEKIFEFIRTNKNKLDDDTLTKFFINAVYADFIFQNEEITDIYENSYINYANKINRKNVDLILRSKINLSQFYLFRAQITKGLECLDGAANYLLKTNNPYYIKQFWYTKAWLNIEKGDFITADLGLERLNDTILDENVVYPVDLYSANMAATIKYQLKDYQSSYFFAKDCYDRAKIIFQSENSNVAGECLVSMSRSQLKLGQHKEAEENIKKAISILTKIFGNKDIDLTQALAHTVLGKLYQLKGSYSKALVEYRFAEKYYEKIFKGYYKEFYEYKALIKDICIFALEVKDMSLLKQYIQKLSYNSRWNNIDIQEIEQMLLDDNNMLLKQIYND